MLLPLLLSISPALALSSRQGGPSLDLAAGLGLGGAPTRSGVGGQLSLGWWTGVYDDQYAFGRYWWFGATGRADWRPDVPGLAPMLEIRRGLELIVIGIAPFVAGGLVLEPSGDRELGFTGRAGLELKLRRSRFWGISTRLEGGVDAVGGGVGFGGGVLLGLSFARPAHPILAPEHQD